MTSGTGVSRVGSASLLSLSLFRFYHQPFTKDRPMIVPSEEEVTAAIEAIKALADTIRELGEVPHGVLYANVMSRMELDVFNVLIDKIISTGLVEKKNNLLVWKGPTLSATR